MKKSCYAIKQTKIEPHILSPCLSNKDSLANDRASLQVFEKLREKDYMANKKNKQKKNIILSGQQNYDNSSVQNNSRLKNVFFFCSFFLER